jgi:spore maturation protein CgeB
MPSRRLRIAYFAHSIRSDWNNGNAHFLRGLLRELVALHHSVRIYEPQEGWSETNLLTEELAPQALAQFHATYPELQISPYAPAQINDSEHWRAELRGCDVVILHEWNEPELAQCLLTLRAALGYRLLFHDTHHRASSAAAQIKRFGIAEFDGVLAFGDALRNIYLQRFGVDAVWTLHEAADTTVFRPGTEAAKLEDVVWIGNWGDGERSQEICEFLLAPAALLPSYRFHIYGVRYPPEGLQALAHAGVSYGGYLPNLDAPAAYANARLTIHIPRQQYVDAMQGIPTIRVFEALACGIPLISAPWTDSEKLFEIGDYRVVHNRTEMTTAIHGLLENPAEAAAQAERGRHTVLARHTCRHRAEELTSICEELTH